MRIFEDDPHVLARLLPAFSVPINMPASIHEQMSGERASIREVNQQPLAARLHLIHNLPGERRVVVEARKHWIGRAKDGDWLADQGAAHCTSGPKEGIAFRHGLLDLTRHRLARGKGQRNAPQMHPEWTGMKARIHQEARHGMRRYRLAVYGGDEHALVACSTQTLLPARTEKVREA